MELADITFGIEIECYIPRGIVASGQIVIGGYHRGSQIPGLPEGWTAQRDGSLGYAPAGYTGVEFVSPVLKGVEGMRQIKLMTDKLHEWQAKVNRTCGFHVHVGFGGTANDLRKLVALCANFQKALYASTGTKARENGVYAAPYKEAFRTLRFNVRNPQYIGGMAHQRYLGLNISNLVAGTKPTVEFRFFSGTVNFRKITTYVRLSVGLVEKAYRLKKAPMWDYKYYSHKEVGPDGVRPDGCGPADRVGKKDVVRLLSALGWYAGKADRVYGELIADDLPSIETSKRVLIRLAAKYDGPDPDATSRAADDSD